MTMADEINSKIIAQGDKIRQMKVDKVGKDALKPEIDLLLSLKNDYKNATGKDWKPGVHGDSSRQRSKQEEPKEVPYTGGGLTDEQREQLAVAAGEALDIKIRSCGDFIRKMKAEKASKERIMEEVEILKFLKGLYKEKTGAEWTLLEAGVGKAKENKKPPNNEQPAAGQQEQGDGCGKKIYLRNILH